MLLSPFNNNMAPHIAHMKLAVAARLPNEDSEDGSESEDAEIQDSDAELRPDPRPRKRRQVCHGSCSQHTADCCCASVLLLQLRLPCMATFIYGWMVFSAPHSGHQGACDLPSWTVVKC